MKKVKPGDIVTLITPTGLERGFVSGVDENDIYVDLKYSHIVVHPKSIVKVEKSNPLQPRSARTRVKGYTYKRGGKTIRVKGHIRSN